MDKSTASVAALATTFAEDRKSYQGVRRASSGACGRSTVAYKTQTTRKRLPTILVSCRRNATRGLTATGLGNASGLSPLGAELTTAVIALDAAGVCSIGAAVLVVAVFWIEAFWKS